MMNFAGFVPWCCRDGAWCLALLFTHMESVYHKILGAAAVFLVVTCGIARVYPIGKIAKSMHPTLEIHF